MTTLPPDGFALAHRLQWRLFKLSDGRLVAHRKAYTKRDKAMTKVDAQTIAWPSDAGDIPDETRKLFADVVAEMSAGLTCR
jgi:hypothetical protein